MTTLALFFSIGIYELLILAALGIGMLAIVGAIVFIAVKLAQPSK